MQQINSLNPWSFFLPILTATLPLLFVLIYNLVEVKSIKIDITRIFETLANIRERLATLEERDRNKNILVKN